MKQNVIILACLFTKLLRTGDREGLFRFSSQAATCLPHVVEATHSLFTAENQAWKLKKSIFVVFGLTEN